MCAHYESAGSNDIWPGRKAPFLIAAQSPKMVLGSFGLMPHWAKPTHYRHTYNARSETVSEKPSFRHAWHKRQFCAVPALAFFEPCYLSGQAQSHRIARADQAPFWMAGLWECYEDVFGEPIWSFTLLTINASDHPLMSRYHGPDDEKRSIVVIPEPAVEHWLNAATDRAAMAMLLPFPASEFVGAAA